VSVLAVARKEFSDSRRSRTLLVIVALFVLIVGGVTFGYAEYFADTGSGPEQNPPTATERTLTAVVILSGLLGNGGAFGPVDLLVPAIGLLLGYKAIVGERESGRIKLLLGLPHSRSDVVFGKLLGRSAVAGLAVLAGFVATALVLALVNGGGVTLVPLVVLVVLTLVLAAVHVSVGIGISALAPSTGWATALVIGVITVFQVLWGAIFFAIRLVVLDPSRPTPTWFRALRETNPTSAYRRALRATLDAVVDRSVGGDATSAGEALVLQDWFGFVLLAAWLTVPFVVGLVVFRNADLT
jgi:ABC-2 type transport system permease protein